MLTVYVIHNQTKVDKASDLVRGLIEENEGLLGGNNPGQEKQWNAYLRWE